MQMNLLFFLVLMAFLPQSTQVAGINAINVLRNADASEGTRFWKTSGNATIEHFEGNPCFVLRRGGQFTQTVSISEGHEDLYVVFIGRVWSEYVHPDGAITDRPYLYGLAFGEYPRILAHLQAETMRGRGDRPQEWETVYGIFHVPDGTTSIYFQLGQGLRKGVPYSGAAARFDDLALYVVTDESAARAIVAARARTSGRLNVRPTRNAHNRTAGVFGASLTLALRCAFEEYGLDHFVERAAGFLASKGSAV